MGYETGDGTVGKAITVLDLVASFGRPVRFSEVLQKSDFPKPTLYRFIQSLTNQNMLSYDADRQTYAPGLRLLRLAHAAWEQSSLAPIARPFLDNLAKSVGEAVHLAQIDNGQVLFIDKRSASAGFDTLAQAGQVAPAYCTGVGKVILAFMDDSQRARALQQQAYMKYTAVTHDGPEALSVELDSIRRDGVAYDREEHETGIISIAAPILIRNDIVIGAVSVATSTSRHDLAGLEAFRPQLLETAQRIGAEAQNWQSPT
ncbi:MAG: IclR family transcriptional regulator [Yoonia sp.]|nr:IclR family transcriptional regulator [Yoonia sp.]